MQGVVVTLFSNVECCRNLVRFCVSPLCAVLAHVEGFDIESGEAERIASQKPVKVVTDKGSVEGRIEPHKNRLPETPYGLFNPCPESLHGDGRWNAPDLQLVE